MTQHSEFIFGKWIHIRTPWGHRLTSFPLHGIHIGREKFRWLRELRECKCFRHEKHRRLKIATIVFRCMCVGGEDVCKLCTIEAVSTESIPRIRQLTTMPQENIFWHVCVLSWLLWNMNEIHTSSFRHYHDIRAFEQPGIRHDLSANRSAWMVIIDTVLTIRFLSPSYSWSTSSLLIYSHAFRTCEIKWVTPLNSTHDE